MKVLFLQALIVHDKVTEHFEAESSQDFTDRNCSNTAGTRDPTDFCKMLLDMVFMLNII